MAINIMSTSKVNVQRGAKEPQVTAAGPVDGVPITSRKRWLLFAACCLFVLAFAKFLHTDRPLYPVNDLTPIWVSSQAFLRGKNPYDDTLELQKIWLAGDVHLSAQDRDYRSVLSLRPIAYPPTALALIAPLDFFNWRTAAWLYVIGSTGLFIFGVILLAQNLHLPWTDARVLFFIAIALALAPLHEGTQEANLNTLTLACICISVGLLSRRPYWSGSALAVAVCLKPQVAIWFIAYYFLRKKWSAALASLTACVLISGSSVLWMDIHQIEWFKPFLEQVGQLQSVVGSSGAFGAGFQKFEKVNLQVLTEQFTRSIEWSKIFAWTIFAILAGASVSVIRRRVSEHNESAGIALIAVLTLLPVYQNLYTAEILLFVAYWAVENLNLKSAKAALLLLLPLLQPVIPWLTAYQGFPQSLATPRSPLALRAALFCWQFIRAHKSSFVLNVLLLPHLIWIELILAAILLFTLHDARRSHPLDAP